MANGPKNPARVKLRREKDQAPQNDDIARAVLRPSVAPRRTNKGVKKA